jgi:hypothetical protein
MIEPITLSRGASSKGQAMGVRYDIARRLVVLLLAGSCIAGVVVETGSASAAAAFRPPRAVATSTQVIGGDGYFTGDTRIWWYSADGTTAVVTTESTAGALMSVEKIEYSLHDGVRTLVQTVLFPAQKAWATFHQSSGCATGCYIDNLIYASPTLNARLLASHQLILSGQSESIDGQTAVEVTSSLDGAVAWMSPTTDEVLTFQSGPSAAVQTFHWLPATRANLDRLKLNVPRSYKKAASTCAESDNPIPPGSGFSGCPALR